MCFPQVIAAFKALQTVTGYSKLAFPSSWDPKRPLSENTLNMALRRLGYEKTEMSAHGFRRTASTILNGAGFNRDWIERQLAHASGDAIRGAYNAAEYLEGRKEMMIWGANKLDTLRGSALSLHFQAAA